MTHQKETRDEMFDRVAAYAAATREDFFRRAKLAAEMLPHDVPSVMAGPLKKLTSKEKSRAMTTLAEANNKILMVNNICQKIINIFLEEKVFGWSDYHQRPHTYYFQGFQEKSASPPFEPIPGMIFIHSYRWVTDYTEQEEIMVPSAWLDDYKEEQVREYAKALFRGIKASNAEETKLAAVKVKLDEIATMKKLMDKYPDTVSDYLRGAE